MTKEITKSLSTSQIQFITPEFINDNYPTFLEFLQTYKRWTDENDNDTKGLHSDLVNFLTYIDIDANTDFYIDHFWESLAQGFPKNILIDKRLFLKHCKQFYTSRGSEKSIRFLFKILFNEDIDFYYPSRDLFRLDNSPWYVAESIIVKDSPVNILDITGHFQIYGNTSNIVTNMEYVKEYNDGERNLLEIFYSPIPYNFINNEPVYTKDYYGNVIDIGTITDFKNYPGMWLNFNSHPSHESRIQDSFFWQDYSYVICTAQHIDEFYPVLKRFCHPSGRKVFCNYRIDNETDSVEKDIEIYDLDIINVELDLNMGEETEIYIGDDPYDRQYFLGTSISGNVSILNDPLISSYETELVVTYETFTGGDFSNWRGVKGDGALFETDLEIVKEVQINANGVFEYDIIMDIVSNTTLRLFYPVKHVLEDAEIAENV